MKMKLFSICLLGAVVLAGCTTYRYEYIAPASESGKSCALQCLNTKTVCYGAAQVNTQNQVNSCQQQNHFSYQACVNRAQSHDDVKRCNPSPQYCPSNPNYWQCDETYRQCFATCGGTVNVYKND